MTIDAEKHPRIEIKPDVMSGKPVIRGTRITVEIVLERLENGYSTTELLEDWPHITSEDLAAALAYARDHLLRSSPIRAA